MKPDGATSSTNGYSPMSNGTGSSHPRKPAVSSSLNGQSPHNSSHGPQTHGPAGSPTLEPSYFGHDREQVTRILIQSLFDLGYGEAASTLSRESKYELESPAISAFRTAVLEGQWAEAEAILLNSFHQNDKGVAGDSDGTGDQKMARKKGLALAEYADKNEMLFCLRQQKFLELLEHRDLPGALIVLRQELTPLNHDVSQLHALSSLLMCPPESLKAQAGFEGSTNESRQRLLSDLSKFISPSVMIPDHRLATLLDHVKQNQINRCLYHNTAETPSLYCDHMCDRNNFPLRTALELSQHTDEVWYLEFSHDGTKLATTSKDHTVIIYETGSYNVIHKLMEHRGSVGYAAWSPDDSKLLTCSMDHMARLWDVESGRCILTIDHHQEPVTSAAWAPDGETFVTGSLDNESQLCHWSVQGQSIYRWPESYRVRDCAISPDGQHLIAISIEKGIYVYNFVTREKEYALQLKLDPTCVNISADSRYMLVNMSDSQVQLLDIDTADVVRHFTGQKQGRFIIRSNFGGAGENFIVSGSEDSKIYVWHRGNGALVEALDGHTAGCVNAVAWNPADPGVFASAGDDRKVRIWSKEPTPTSAKSVLMANGSARSSLYNATSSRPPSSR